MWLRLFIVSLCVVSICLAQENVVDNVDSYDEYYPQLDWSDEFDWTLLKTVSNDQEGNVLISPLSLKLALIMLYEGSAGSTERQFQTVLSLGTKNETRSKYKKFLESVQSNTKDLTTNIGTRLFLESSIRANQQFSSTIKAAYDADVEPTNFSQPIEASKTINSWVDSVTNGHIKQLTTPDEITDDVILYVANAIFFKGSWRTQFPKNNTRDGGFYVSPTNLVTVSYIANTEKYYYADSTLFDAKIIRLPYQGQHFSLFLILPNSKGGLPELLKRINLSTIKQHLYLMDKKTVSVIIPKFKFEFSSSYSNILQELGLNSIFSNTASLPGIARGVGTKSKFLFVNDVKQKTGIEVNEEGSIAFASTDIQLGNKFGEPEFTFNATHPFLFFLEDQLTGTILFSGKITNPLSAENIIKVPPRFDDGEISPITVSNNIASEPEIPTTTTPVLATHTTDGQFANNQPGQQQNGQNQNQGANFSPNSNTQEDMAISSRFNYFDLEMLQLFNENENYFISPASIKITLAMLLEGSRGKCAQEISKILRIPVDVNSSRATLNSLLNNLSTKIGTTVLNAANIVAISNRYTVVERYRNILQEHYKAQLVSVDYRNSLNSANSINNWVKQATNNLISEIISADNFNDEASLVIANALYFKAQWKTQFEKKSRLENFHTNVDTYPVQTMKVNSQFRYRYVEDVDSQAVELPYSDGEYAMLILLPSEKHTIDGLQRDLQHYSFATIIDSLEQTEMLVSLPKFDIEYSADLGPTLETMGIKEIFSENANLTGIVEQGEVRVSKILHKAKVEVNEKGTTAAAVTGAIVVPLMGSSSERFIANRPFLFFIYNVNNKNILFEGRLNKPPRAYETPTTETSSRFSNNPVPNPAASTHYNNLGNQAVPQQNPSPIHFSQSTSSRSGVHEPNFNRTVTRDQTFSLKTVVSRY